jgi:CheY-like chemotaxis protein
VASAPAISASVLYSPSGEFSTMPRVVAYMDDLFFQMKLAETAKHLGLEVKVAGNAQSLLELLDPLPALVIVDLNARSSPLDAVERARAAHPNLRVVGFLSHVETELAAKARSAGFDEVMPRSKFSMHLPRILTAAARLQTPR